MTRKQLEAKSRIELEALWAKHGISGLRVFLLDRATLISILVKATRRNGGKNA
jgi:hypothetical protein